MAVFMFGEQKDALLGRCQQGEEVSQVLLNPFDSAGLHASLLISSIICKENDRDLVKVTFSDSGRAGACRNIPTLPQSCCVCCSSHCCDRIPDRKESEERKVYPVRSSRMSIPSYR